MKNWKQNNIRNAGILRSEKTGEEVNIGDCVTDFRGEFAEVTGWDYPHKPGSTGRVYTKRKESDISSNFPSVFGLVIENE